MLVPMQPPPTTTVSVECGTPDGGTVSSIQCGLIALSFEGKRDKAALDAGHRAAIRGPTLDRYCGRRRRLHGDEHRVAPRPTGRAGRRAREDAPRGRGHGPQRCAGPPTLRGPDRNPTRAGELGVLPAIRKGDEFF